MPTERRFVRSPGRTASQVYDDEAVVINTSTGRYYDLEGSGVDLWTLVEHGITPQEGATVLAARFDVEAAEALPQVTTFLEALLAEDLVELAAGSGPPPTDALGARRPYVPPAVTTFTDMEELLAADPPLPADYTPVWQPPTGDA